MKHWLGIVCREHVERGRRLGIAQLGHGKRAPLERLSPGDWLIYYSPRTSLHGGEPLQAFTALGRVADDELYQVEMEPGFVPWRRNVEFVECVHTPIRPLIDQLTFIKNKQRWGYVFRFGLFEIPERDFELIRRAMTEGA